MLKLPDQENDWFGGESLDWYPCACCGELIEIAELCEQCATDNDPFFVADNCGKDLR